MLTPLPGGCALAAIASALLASLSVSYFFGYNDTCGLLNTSALHVQYETRHLLNSRVQNALDCISEKFNLKTFSGGACARNSLEKCAPILPLYTISQAPFITKSSVRPWKMQTLYLLLSVNYYYYYYYFSKMDSSIPLMTSVLHIYITLSILYFKIFGREVNFLKIVHLYVFISFWLKYEVN